ncbi:hypothetical protein DL89DRAFT_129867 [Linderina pennispora]|uniref:Uncharacterized protein n=1 Tax=Linderina pennispora TaxID=61395 RepID=A0A1Y1WEG3_9FUNG|nr:uncharacterized protein DL89DRAFT_129867 [Linderina pennispora]ORX71636.1 hypothetical protein DL89DRAFT_129867 [Linderina pennispora]
MATKHAVFALTLAVIATCEVYGNEPGFVEVGYAPQVLVASQQYEANRPYHVAANAGLRAGEASSASELGALASHEHSASESSKSSKNAANTNTNAIAGLAYAVAAASIACAWAAY